MLVIAAVLVSCSTIIIAACSQRVETQRLTPCLPGEVSDKGYPCCKYIIQTEGYGWECRQIYDPEYGCVMTAVQYEGQVQYNEYVGKCSQQGFCVNTVLLYENEHLPIFHSVSVEYHPCYE